MDSVSDLFLVASDAYDSEIIREGNDVCQRLDLPVHVRRIYWADGILWHTFHSDECFFHGKRGLFPARMKGRLEPREWRPIIASSRIFRQYGANPPLRDFLVGMLSLFVLLTIVAEVSAGSFGGDGRLALALSILFL